jgi:hypothetical protein
VTSIDRLAIRPPTALSFKHCTLPSDLPYPLVQGPRGPVLPTARVEQRDSVCEEGKKLKEMFVFVTVKTSILN